MRAAASGQKVSGERRTKAGEVRREPVRGRRLAKGTRSTSALEIHTDGQDGQDKEEMMSDECGMMNEEQAVFDSSFITPHSPFPSSCSSCPSV
jgi:hypothetical protein